MKATIGELPTGDDWAFELKWDGVRLQATYDLYDPSSPPTLRSTSGRDVTSTYPEFAALATSLALPAVLDGEAVVFDGDRPSFGRLQHRMHVARPTSRLVEDHPAVYIVFDLLVLDGQSMLDLPYTTRRKFLADVFEDGPSWRAPPAALRDGQALLDLATARGLEGVVAKKLASRYQPGGRGTDWLKIKIRQRQEFVVGGWLGGQGNLEGMIGSLLLGVWHDDVLCFVGAVGSGLAERDRKHLSALLTSIEVCPFGEIPNLDRIPTWVEPVNVVEVEYGSWPATGNLRHPVYAGLRPDHDPADVVRELPPRPSDVG